MDMVCKCGGKEFFTEEHGNQTGLYCSACGKWQKWLKKDEIRLCRLLCWCGSQRVRQMYQGSVRRY